MFRLFFLVCLSVVHAQLEVNGTCELNNIKFPTTLSERIAGTWYQIERIPNSVEQGDCAHINITIAIDNTTSALSAHMYNSEVVNGKLVLRSATITPTLVPGIWNLTINDNTSQNLIILGTDYDEYAMLYSCHTNGTISTISAWKLGRRTMFTENAINATRSLAERANIPNTAWKVVQHTEAACKLNNGAVNLHTSPVLLLLLALIGLTKQL